MILISDIYFKVDSKIVSQNFWEVNIKEKKKLIDIELKRYIISKIQELDGVRAISSETEKELSVSDLLQILADSIPTEEHFDTLRHFTHYIIIVAGSLQNYSITWWVEEDEEFKIFPLVEFDGNGLWNNLKTHKETDYIKTFNFVYDIFNNNFMIKDNIPKQLIMRLQNNEG